MQDPNTIEGPATSISDMVSLVQRSSKLFKLNRVASTLLLQAKSTAVPVVLLAGDKVEH